ncbi:MAG: ferric reductase-like transmembrane domain-containing protein, partial [Candidatus Dormibacteraeota bacterium]|nr:ferric reductase-like transmembrane domain-containing protein [Candidatus Dormibacteraeota bacterium]
TPFWYATRGSGYTALVLLSAVVVLGVVTSVRWSAPGWPRFLSQSLHRNLSLLALLFLVIHVAASIIDPFAGLTLRDAVVPAGASYRPLWLGLGVVGLELFVAVLLTSLLRRHLRFWAWRAVHLLSYASWPVAVLHGIGTGTDTKSVWAILLVLACVVAVAVAMVWRLLQGWPSLVLLRVAGLGATAAAAFALVTWSAAGPLQPGWAAAAGTPADLLRGGGPSSAPQVPALATGLDDTLLGTLSQSASSTTATFTDTRDNSLVFTVVVAADGSGTLQVTRSGTTLCDVRATVTERVVALCGTVQVTLLNLFTDDSGRVHGTVQTQ